MAEEMITFLRRFDQELELIRDSRPADLAVVMNRTRSILVGTLSAVRDGEMSATDIIRVLESAFGGGGLFAREAIPWVEPAIGEVKYLAACFYMAMNYAKANRSMSEDCIMKVASMGFMGEADYTRFKDELKVVEKLYPGRSHVDVVDFLVSDLHMNPRFDHKNALLVYASGGLARCLEIGTSPAELMHKIMDNLERTPVSVDDFAKLHQFCTDINAHLFENLSISRNTFSDNAEKLLSLTLKLTKSRPALGAQLAEKVPSIRGMGLSVSEIMGFASVTSKGDNQIKEKLATSSFKDVEIKAAVQRLDAGVQPQVINRLELNNLFSRSEMNRIKGRRLEQDLGM